MITNLPYTTKHGLISTFFLLLLFFLTPLHITAQQPRPYQDHWQAQFSPSMAIIVGVLIAALFFMGFFSIFIRHCSDPQSNSGPVRLITGTRWVARGLDPGVIEKFPTFNYAVVKQHKIGKGALECAVCLNEFEDDETLRLIPKCDHVFHPECIDEWLASHTTCPVCRADLVLQPGESIPQLTELTHESPDLEAQSMNNDNNMEEGNVNVSQTLNNSLTRGSRYGRTRNFARSHSTGHESLVQPGENTDRFTLRLPVEVRKQVMNRKLNRAISMVVLPSEGSPRQGYRTGGEGSSRGKNSRRLEKLDPVVKPDRWAFSMSFISRALSVRSPKVAANDGDGISVRSGGPGDSSGDSSRLPV